MNIVLAWNAKKALDAFSNIIDKIEDGNEILINWFGKDYFKKLLDYNGNDVQGANEWVRESLKCDISNIRSLLQQISNETKDNELVQRRLKAIGYTPEG